ncbi:uncharacterized protein LOC119668062 [Teleopsis dalmanni]|uniref:uncharacterized protein LOC119668061 n=1 Tax=Teleopsis dalmanni TaxID=139649 RepID=UPI0018CF3F7A|nr:uncharacterized protein LOC119668061 [Teleopsis dalmanni]XP_037933368.1 uncharacterized protein LOC119668061 [Teleopsis dalmanni]XP_037933369.1 uncharacterized protein LOC119668061 [Teleopsis dalmanni]XP_037933370.1 uncharacterized protein LOC119668062 [Teleopsis dalmanni]XP_037933371.1 uncharacterized protein LOC119668062 [Teleopsis dalmanni]XP_037933372.1 uncharacterized protein LOC119668062 [Teleopsis dalmanni]
MLVKQLVKQGLLFRNAAAITRAAYHDGGLKPSTMNDLPIPSGDWQEQYSRQNSKYNAVLILGVLTLVGTISIAKTSGLIELNYAPPKSLD